MAHGLMMDIVYWNKLYRLVALKADGDAMGGETGCISLSCDAVLVGHLWVTHGGECKSVMWFLAHLVFNNGNY